MTRKIVAIILLISFVAVASSGLLMFVIERPSFTIRMHPVHKSFSLLLVGAVVMHLALNRKLLFGHLKSRGALIVGSILLVALFGAYIFAAGLEMPPELVRQMDEAAAAIGSLPH